jgi:hypothetical protein
VTTACSSWITMQALRPTPSAFEEVRRFDHWRKARGEKGDTNPAVLRATALTLMRVGVAMAATAASAREPSELDGGCGGFCGGGQ